MAAPTSVYAADHSKDVVAMHSQRTAENSAAYLLPYLKPHFSILDVGCGPGSITIGLAKLVPQGHVTGIEYSVDPLPGARELAIKQGVANIEFKKGDIHQLPFADSTFDVVHVHQVLQHIVDPVLGLREMRRVVKPGGIVACKETGSMLCYPDSPLLEKFWELRAKAADKMGGEPHPGRKIHVWAKQAGFETENVKCSSSSWTFATREEREYWGGTFAERVRKGHFAELLINGGYATRDELEEVARGWRSWVEDEDGWYGVLNGEILCTKV